MGSWGVRTAIVILAAGLMACTIDLGSLTRVPPLEESTVLGESGPKIVLLELDGLLTEARSGGVLGAPKPSIVARAREVLDRAAEDDGVAAILLRINSPGGTVSASETLHHEILKWKEETGKTVVAHFQGLAASGGYYIAMTADHIVAHPTTVTGSIGVIMLGLNMTELMEKIGIADQTLVSGEYKDSGSMFRPMREDERLALQSVIDDLYGRFREIVTAGRPALQSTDLDRVANGRIFSASQALENGLIDEIGYLDDAVEAAEERAGIHESRVVTYHLPSEYRDNLYTRRDWGTSLPPIQIVDVNLLDLPRLRLEPGFYYLWPTVLH